LAVRRFASLIALLVPLAVGCDSSNTGSITATGHALKLDERLGTYGPVAIGDSTRKIEKQLGQAPKWKGTLDTAPLGARQDQLSGSSGLCRLKGQRKYIHDDFLRYTAVSIWAPGERACSFQVTAPNATTRRGVGIGQPLHAAKVAYPELFCGVANENSEYATYPYCKGRLASGTYIWFGGDPINDIEYGYGPLNP
jgi:hypothetical protein